ncbi:hypothetical protein CEP45_00370 [Mergibacter septicus]|uniref:virulence factor BrkB family protein n=1 Tax=Mergibacter septicus TaxID=221402 RepID=UPI001C76AF58|nr:virulence factor BrkB family protein [Mergibacter septicus]QDJ12399.1 hypothetical protein CEP45_00370 [Mergibacter septicus]
MQQKLRLFFAFIQLFGKRIAENKLSQAAGYLTYSTLLAIVPLIVVVFSFIAVFPVFDQLSNELRTFIFHNFAPSAGNVVESYVTQFVENTKKISAVGILGLIAVALMLIHSIDKTLNAIWTNTQKRSLFYSFSIYWLILTIGPLLIGVGIAVSSYIFSSKIFYVNTLPFGIRVLTVVPFILTWLAFTAIYSVVPNTKVNIKYASCGALVAAIFFTLGKAAFAWYMRSFPSYHLIYGALATIPIMIVWVHLSWLVILFGAQLTAVLEDLHLFKQGKLGLDLHFTTRQQQEPQQEDKQ